MTHPRLRTASAPVSPTPPGQEPGSAVGSIVTKVLTWPPGVTWTIVVPVPCRFALLLKLLISAFPCPRPPTLSGMSTKPYGFTSPLLGTAEATTETA